VAAAAAATAPPTPPVDRLQIGAGDLPTQYRHLVAQHQDLHLVGAITPRGEGDQF
jgi:hypothetical protein